MSHRRQSLCVCGCGRRGIHRHHVVYQQELRHLVREQVPHGPPALTMEMVWIADPRNIVFVGFACHAAHHNRSKPYELRWLPDAAFEFAEEKMGAGRAYEYLKRRYDGADARLDALLAAA